ncbi:UDP-N-acetylglucosamine 1-carboxyvinyltransferase [Hydrogenobaculum acidophilum]
MNEAYLLIEESKHLKGTLEVSGAKNAALPLMAATILTEEPCIIRNVPNLLDIKHMIELLTDMGKKIHQDKNTLYIEGPITNKETREDIVRRMRASVLAMGPLIAKYKSGKVSMPGGCSIGARPIDQHLKAAKRMGVEIEIEQGFINLKASMLNPIDFTFDVITVTGTENVLCMLSTIEEESILKNIAIEPEVINLVEALKQMGVDINIDEENRVANIKGSKYLKGFDIEVIPDRIEAGTFMVLAIATNSSIKIENVNVYHLKSIVENLKIAGANVDILSKDSVLVSSKNGVINPLSIETSEYPGFPTDMQAQFMSLLSVAKGESSIVENIFENRFQHAQELARMGACITIHSKTASIKGVEHLKGAEVFSTDLRASAGLVIAGLMAEGKSIIRNIYHLDRGYDHIEQKLEKIGAKIKRVNA